MNKITYLSQKQSELVDQELIAEHGLSLAVLMELAGQSVAHCIQDCNRTFHAGKLRKFLFICGPGNNGGDALVAARHLSMLSGKECVVLLFKPPSQPLIRSLVTAC